MTQAEALIILEAGYSVCLTGAAGSGKTYVLNQFIKRARADGKTVSVTATTGLAATHLNGTTIHAWSGIGIHNELPRRFVEHLTKSRRDIIEKTDVLIIDEISMLHDYRLEMVEQITREVRGNDKPFGGLQIILCGDFFQLPPVNREDGKNGGFVVSSEAWHKLDPIICYLHEQHRQNDDMFLEILNALRSNDIRRRHAEMLLSRMQIDISSAKGATVLHTTNVDVDNLNLSRLHEIDEPEQRFHMTTTGRQQYVDSLKRSCLASEVLVLKKGALVMCIRNSAEKKYANGSLGFIKDFEPLLGYPIVELLNGRTVSVSPETWELRDGDKKRASVTQVPLRLAWAITVHKSQGMTLDAAHIDLSRAFVEGMGYVALSRVRSLDALSLGGLNRMALQVSQEALEIEKLLLRKSDSDKKRLQHVFDEAQKKPPKKVKASKSVSWADKVAKMREKYPNAYRPWTEEDDQRLRNSYDNGQTTASELAAAFGRHQGSIVARLKKQYGEDVVIKI